jgi:hypothetical protein
MPATVIAERIGWTLSIRVPSGRVAAWRPDRPPDPASRTAYVAGEIAQCDLWFPPIMLPGFRQVLWVPKLVRRADVRIPPKPAPKGAPI